LTAKVNALEQQLSPVMPTEKEIAAHRAEAHAMAEARASRFNAFTPDQLRAMHEACPNPQSIVQDQRGAPQGPASILPRTSQPASNVRGPVNTTGWQHFTPLRNGLGQGK
jgi:hypothetical protein